MSRCAVNSSSPTLDFAPTVLPAALICALACALLLISERRDVRAGVWLAKPVAAAAFVAAGLSAGIPESLHGRLVVAGLCLSWWGDVLLIPRERPLVFLVGIASFLLAHVAYAAAFLSLELPLSPVLVGALLATLAALAVGRWLAPHLRDLFRRAVPLYIVVIAAMLALSVGAGSATGDPRHVVAALGFAVSDVSVARDRFVAPGFTNAAWGLPLYFVSQLIFASTVAEP